MTTEALAGHPSAGTDNLGVSWCAARGVRPPHWRAWCRGPISLLPWTPVERAVTGPPSKAILPGSADHHRGTRDPRGEGSGFAQWVPPSWSQGDLEVGSPAQADLDGPQPGRLWPLVAWWGLLLRPTARGSGSSQLPGCGGETGASSPIPIPLVLPPVHPGGSAAQVSLEGGPQACLLD